MICGSSAHFWQSSGAGQKQILRMYSASTVILGNILGWKSFKIRKNQMKQAEIRAKPYEASEIA